MLLRGNNVHAKLPHLYAVRSFRVVCSEGSSFCDELINRAEESYRVCVSHCPLCRKHFGT